MRFWFGPRARAAPLAIALAAACASVASRSGSSTAPASQRLHKGLSAATAAVQPAIAGLSAAQGPWVLDPIEVVPRADPLASLSERELKRWLVGAPARLGSASLGLPNRGALMNGVALRSGPGWKITDPDRAWGTWETVGYLKAAIVAFRKSHPDAPTLFIGDLSRRRGGWLRPHRSHQSGRDADIGYFYRDGEGWYREATRENLDVELTWALLQALCSEGDVEYVFIDRHVQRWLVEHALASGTPRSLLAQLFEVEAPRRRATLIRHTRGHGSHMHVRFHNNTAEATGRHVAGLWRRYRPR